jgi:hypothetical protein
MYVISIPHQRMTDEQIIRILCHPARRHCARSSH